MSNGDGMERLLVPGDVADGFSERKDDSQRPVRVYLLGAHVWESLETLGG